MLGDDLEKLGLWDSQKEIQQGGQESVGGQLCSPKPFFIELATKFLSFLKCLYTCKNIIEVCVSGEGISSFWIIAGFILGKLVPRYKDIAMVTKIRGSDRKWVETY